MPWAMSLAELAGPLTDFRTNGRGLRLEQLYVCRETGMLMWPYFAQSGLGEEVGRTRALTTVDQ